jgi:CheY-like chemotaxis protein
VHRTSGGAAPESRASVLVIDDDDHVREAVTVLLEDSGFVVTGCPDALDALARLRGGSLPDLILLDLMMPEMNGWEFRLEQRSNVRWAEIPVLALSADRSAQAAAIDADGYLSKPVDRRQLIEAVTRLATRAPRSRPRAESVEKYRPLGELAAEIVRQAESPVGAALGSLQLAQVKAGQLMARLRGAEAFSMVGIRQLLQRVQRAVEHIEAVMHGTAAFAQLAGADLLAPVPRLLIVEAEPGTRELFALGSEDEYEISNANAADALARLRRGELFELVLCELNASSHGTGFYERLLAIAPELAARVVFIVDADSDERVRRFLASTRRPQLRRPFTPAELRALIDEQLKMN